MCVYRYNTYYMATRLMNIFFLYQHCTYTQQRLLCDLKIDNRIWSNENCGLFFFIIFRCGRQFLDLDLEADRKQNILCLEIYLHNVELL